MAGMGTFPAIFPLQRCCILVTDETDTEPARNELSYSVQQHIDIIQFQAGKLLLKIKLFAVS